jgi:hypothetical protein
MQNHKPFAKILNPDLQVRGRRLPSESSKILEKFLGGALGRGEGCVWLGLFHNLFVIDLRNLHSSSFQFTTFGKNARKLRSACTLFPHGQAGVPPTQTLKSGEKGKRPWQQNAGIVVLLVMALVVIVQARSMSMLMMRSIANSAVAAAMAPVVTVL